MMNEQTEEQAGRATFVVQVQFKQNATWQGTIKWLDGRKTQSFRSTLEMLKLMDEAVSSGIEDTSDNDRWIDGKNEVENI